VISKYKDNVPVEIVFQSVDKLPAGFTCPAERTKPWGTTQAVLMGAEAIAEPFAVINADDYYGPESFKQRKRGSSRHSFPLVRRNVQPGPT
jgi:dTDP-glucose pyrophosphorylase